MGRIGDDAAFPDSGVWNIADVYRYLRVLEVPAVVQSAALWLDAADLTTITESGGDVSQWNNKGTLGNFTQASGALQPTTGVSTFNGLNVLNFASDFLRSSDAASVYKFLHDGTKYLVAAVWQAGTTANPGVNLNLLGTNPTSINVGALFGYVDAGASNDQFVTNITRGVAGSFALNNDSPAGSFIANTSRLLTVLADPLNGTAANRSEIFINNGSAVKNNTATAAVSASNPSFALDIGSGGNAVNPLTGKIAEIVIVSGADATEGNRVIIRNYLNAKWDVF